MQHLNYCRQIAKQFAQSVAIPSLPEESRQMLGHVLDLIPLAQKFLLPHGGRMLDDLEYRALDDSEPLRLPYPVIALEYSRSENELNVFEMAARTASGYSQSSKAAVIVRERETNRGQVLVITVLMWIDATGIWSPLPEVALPTVGYLDRTQRQDGRVQIRFFNPNPDRVPDSDYDDEVGSLLCLLNALQCSNVRAERSEPKKAKVKSALPFDSYRILTIGRPGESGVGTTGSHRSPREHLRRGHIRRYESGLKIWINAHVVAAGAPGKITKDYRIAA